MMRKYSLTLSLLLIVSIPLLLFGASVSGAADRHHRRPEVAVRLLKTVPIPGTDANPTAPAPNGKLYSFDISWVDQSTQTYYLADRSNVAVDVVDAKTAGFIGQIS